MTRYWQTFLGVLCLMALLTGCVVQTPGAPTPAPAATAAVPTFPPTAATSTAAPTALPPTTVPVTVPTAGPAAPTVAPTAAPTTAPAPTAAKPAPTVPPAPPAPTQAPAKRIEFPAGSTAISLQGSAGPGTADHWVLKAQTGQMMTLKLTSATGTAVLVVWGQEGTPLITDHAGATDWTGTLPHTEEYFIDVLNQGAAATTYTLVVTIPPLPTPAPVVKRITFAAGAISATVNGNLAARNADGWVIKAGAGQTLTAQLNPAGGQAILVIYGADGTVLISDHAGAAAWSGPLPSTQDYNISVRNVTDAAVAYNLTVTVPPAPAPQPTVRRITFAPGGTSATVYGNVAANASDRWVIGARAGQTMEVSLQGGGVLIIVGPGGTVLLSDHAGASTWAGILPANGDYSIDVKSTGAAISYALSVGIPPH